MKRDNQSVDALLRDHGGLHGLAAELARISHNNWCIGAANSVKVVVLQQFLADTRSAPMPTECSGDLFGFAPVEGREVIAAFDGGAITSDAGALLLGAADRAIAMMGRFAACFHDVRDKI